MKKVTCELAPIWDEPTIVPPSKHTENMYTGNTTQHQKKKKRWPRGGRKAAPDQRPENTGTQEYPRPGAGTSRPRIGAPAGQPGEVSQGQQAGGPDQGPTNSTGSEQQGKTAQSRTATAGSLS